MKKQTNPKSAKRAAKTQKITNPLTAKAVRKHAARERVEKLDENLLQLKPRKRTNAEIEADLQPDYYCRTCRFCLNGRCTKVNNRPVDLDFNRCWEHSMYKLTEIISMTITQESIEVETITKVG